MSAPTCGSTEPHAPHRVDRGAFGVRDCPGMSAPTPEPAPLDLDALERLLTRATAGPWRVVLDDTENATTVWQVCTSLDHPTDDPDYGVYDCCADGGLHSEPWYREADAEFVAAARNALPELIRRAREADRVRPVVDAAREWSDAPIDGAEAATSRLLAAVDALGPDAPDGECMCEAYDCAGECCGIGRCSCTPAAGDPHPRGDGPAPDAPVVAHVQADLDLPPATERALGNLVRAAVGDAPDAPVEPAHPDGRCLAVWSIAGPAERVAEQARIALTQMAGEYADAGPVKLRAELRTGGEPR